MLGTPVQELKTWVQILTLLLASSNSDLLSLRSLGIKWDQTVVGFLFFVFFPRLFSLTKLS